MELLFRVIKTDGTRDDVIAAAANFIVASAAFDTFRVALAQGEHIELRQGARVIHTSKKE